MQDSCMRASFRRGETGEIIDEDAQLSQKPLFAFLCCQKATRTSQELGVLRDALVVEGREVNARQSSVWRSRCGAACSSCALTNGRRRRLRRAESSGFWSSTRTWMVWRSQAFPLVNSGLSEDEEFTRAGGGAHGGFAASPEEERRGSGGEGAVFEGACRAAGCCSSEAGGCAARADAVPDASSI
ncbi:hypothetical protein TcBrA4_0117000 [Trypanosoma cruzi]|nr:hypothetical protein TcBrA4_0117000 [Trypanosoma cruzi]